MKIQDHLNQRYSLLCQQKGDLTFQLQKIQERIKEIDSQIAGLDDITPLLNQIERSKPVQGVPDGE